MSSEFPPSDLDKSEAPSAAVGSISHKNADSMTTTLPPEKRRNMGRWLWDVPGLLVIGFVRVYQWTLSPIIGRDCRYQPTCSHYFIGSVRKYGAVRGTWRGLKRIARCHPWGGSGYDPP